jgi:YVTN family beta-propeller protein
MTNTTAFIRTLALGLSASLIAGTIAADTPNYEGSLIVVNKRADTVSFIDLDQLKVVSEIPTGQGPHEVAVTNDGTLAVVTNYVGGDSLSVYDMVTATQLREISLADYPKPHGILFMKDQQHVAVSTQGANAVVIANPFEGTITQVLPTEQDGSHMVALPASSERIYTTNMGPSTVSELDVATGRILRQMDMPQTPEAITVNQAGTELWVGSNEDGWVSVYNLDTGNLIKRWEGFTWPYRILLTQDEQYAVVPDILNDTLDIYDAVTKEHIRQISFDAGTAPNGMVYYTDDRTLFMAAYNRNSVIAIRIPSGEVLFEMEVGDGPDGIGYSALKLAP